MYRVGFFGANWENKIFSEIPVWTKCKLTSLNNIKTSKRKPRFSSYSKYLKYVSRYLESNLIMILKLDSPSVINGTHFDNLIFEPLYFEKMGSIFVSSTFLHFKTFCFFLNPTHFSAKPYIFTFRQYWSQFFYTQNWCSKTKVML